MLDFLFGFLLTFEPVIATAIFAAIIIIVINVFYRILINQRDAKQLKENVKELNKKMKEEQKAGNTEKVKEIMSDVMKENSRLMRMTMKPMIVSFVIVIVFLPWLAGVYGDMTVATVNGTGNLTIMNRTYLVEENQNSIKINELNINCTLPCEKAIENFDWRIKKESGNIKFSRAVVRMPFELPVFGYYLGWLGWYILVSIPVMIITRKLMKINV